MKFVVAHTLLALTACAWADSPDALTILTRAHEAYTGQKSYEIRALVINETSNPDFEQTTKSKLLVAYEQPGKFRMESKGMGGITSVSDGEQTWTYYAFLKQYMKGGRPEPLSQELMSGAAAQLSIERPGSSVQSAKLTGEESLTVAGSLRPCYVLEIMYQPKTPHGQSPDGPVRFWVEKSTYLVLKSASKGHSDKGRAGDGPVDTATTIVAQSLKVNEPLPAELFTFTPPESAKLVDKFQPPGMKNANLTGKPAPDFKLRDLSGNQVQLSTYRGKIVLLDFWATWCEPCREEMPVLEAMHQHNKDLMIFGVDVREDLETVQKFVSENKITFPILLAGEDHMLDDYAANSYPTVVVIDKNGLIRKYSSGYGPEMDDQLRAWVADAAQPSSTPGPAPSGAAAVYKIGDGVSAPTVTHKVEPEYSKAARKARLEGTVGLGLIVSADGMPQDIRVIRPFGSGLDEKAISAVSKWRFRPGMKNGTPVPVQVTVDVNFRVSRH